MDLNPSQPPVSTPVDTGMHKEDQQAIGGPTSLGVTNEERTNPQLSSGINPHVLADQTKSVSEGLENVPTQPIIGKEASSIARQVKEDEASSTIKLEDLAKLVSNVEPRFKDLDSPEDDPVIVVVDSDEDEEDEVHPTPNSETEDTSVPKSSSPSSSLPTELKDIPSKFNKLTKELEDFTKTVTSLTSQVAELKTLEWELPTEFLSLPVQVASVQDKLKTLDAFSGLLLNVTQDLNKFAQVLNSASSKAGDHSVPLAGQANTGPTEGEKDTNQATISQLFQRRANKNAEKDNLNNQQPKPVPSIITTTTQM
ncbi:hypothetical protein Tco_1542646, partial [Tanacetum coccineum]